MEVLVTVTLLGIGYFFNRRENKNSIISNKKIKNNRENTNKVRVKDVYNSSYTDIVKKKERDRVYNNNIRSR